MASLAMVAMIVACGGQSHGSGTTPKTSPKARATTTAPSPGSLAGGTVAVFDQITGATHVVTLVQMEGSNSRAAKVLVRATFRRRSSAPPASICPLRATCGGALEPQYVSTTKDKVYVLDGDSDVYALWLNGKRSRVTSIPGTATVPAAFAVSPDDAEIAVATLGSGSRVLYVERLGGGARVKLATSGTEMYWPIGWHDGKILLASGAQFGVSSIPLNPYGAAAYGMLDPRSNALVAVGSKDCAVTGFPSSAGTACVTDLGQQCLGNLASARRGQYYYFSCLRRIDWAGKETIFLLPNAEITKPVVSTVAALSPDGRAILTAWLFLAQADDAGRSDRQWAWPSANPSSEQPDIAWIDANHISWNFLYPDGTSGQRIVAFGPDYASARGVSYDGPPIRGMLVATMPSRS